jgi:transcriptional regulator with XRE-family HTH domain
MTRPARRPNATKIGRLRDKAKLTQMEASALAGIPQTVWSQIERRTDYENITVATMRKIAKALGVPLSKLIE